MDLNIIWFILVGVLIIGYAILDGFDFGVGILSLFVKDDREKRIHFNAIGPVWDGNEVWLLTGGGALFAAFPVVYATVFSGFYLALMLLLVAFIARAVSFEFRSKVESLAWRAAWDWAFGIGSLLPALLLGVAFGNILGGVPIDEHGTYQGTFFGLLNPFALVVGLLSVILFVLHGAVYLTMKCEGALQQRYAALISKLWIGYVVQFIAASLLAFLLAPHLFETVMSNPLFWVLLIVLLGAIISLPIATKAEKYGIAFISSSVTIAGMIGLSALSLFPRLVPSSLNLLNSLTIYNASSTPRTLNIMLIIALIGVPIVLSYTIYIYRVFKGKVKITEASY